MNSDNRQANPNLINDFRAQVIKEDLPDILYHYTSIEGFKGIVESQQIWATAAKHLITDPSELTHAKHVALEVLRKRKRDFKGDAKLYTTCIKLVQDSDRHRELQCICSFSEEGNLLSQWRAYCPKGGVSIGFSVPKYSKAESYLEAKQGGGHDYVHENYIYKCIYDQAEQEKKINELIAFLLKNRESNQRHGFFWKMIQTFAYCFKHKSFAEEKEWRLCYFVDSAALNHRPYNGMLLAYLPVLPVDRNAKSIIRKIIIGPSKHKEMLKEAIALYLAKRGLSVPVTITDTPYQPL